jgi:GTP cyclohydrolase II
VVIYLQQEGRGIGLINKLRAYHLQDMGFDTVDANTCLGFPVDARDYRVASEIIQLLNIKSVALLTNNPEKIEGLKKEGIQVTKRIPLVIEANRHNREYLKTKRKRMGHLF